MTIEHLKTSDLIPYARNAKKHDAAQISKLCGSIKEFGFTNPVLIDRDNGIIAGHGRVLAAQSLALESVPCIRLGHLTDTQRRAYILADNRLAEIGGGWDEEMLKLELAHLGELDVDLEAIGFGAEDLADLDMEDESETSDVDAEPQIDKAEELRAKWGVETGQLWELGDHRLLCGDSTKIKFGEECPTLFFDPPWDAMQPTTRRDNVLAFADGQRLHDVVDIFGAPNWLFVWDCVSSWYTPNRPLRRMKLCAFYGQIENYNSDGAHYGDAGEQREVFNSRGSYTFKPDPRGKHLSDVFSAPITKLHSDSEHSHSKPMDWIRMLIANCTTGDVYDPYAGSGTCLMACEQLKRKCRAVEIDPAFCAVIIDRWATATGGFPKISDETIRPL
jgi:hypothetical protein